MDSKLVILKLGSSVLRDHGDLPAAVHEIYREVRRGRRVLAVVSAFAATTDRLRDQAQARYARPHPVGLAALLASGEAVSAAWLAMALDDAGVPAVLLDPARVGLVTEGGLLDATPVGLDASAITRSLSSHPVAVLPGFLGCDASGAVSLLGRGGSDLTAIFLAARLGADSCRLLKDVDGLYTADPAAGGEARRYRKASWDDVLATGGKLVQPKAVRFAREHGVRFAIAAPGGGTGTEVGPQPSRLDPAPARTAPRLRVALLGLGTVGLHVFRALRDDPGGFDVTGILVRDPARERPGDIPRALLTNEPDEVLARPADVVVELLAGREPALALVRRALAAGRHVVTANKQVVAAAGDELEALGASRGVELAFSAAVGGAVPMLERVRALAAGGTLRRLRGVLNGTCNFVLDEVGAGATFADAVRRAQELGFAEADPSLDLGGGDAAAKLALLVRAGFGVDFAPGDVACRGIDALDALEVRAARLRGATVRLVATAERTVRGMAASVEPVTLAADDPLAQLQGEENGLVIEGTTGWREELRGKGAGGAPTALAVMADLRDLARSARPVPPAARRASQPETAAARASC